MNTTFTPKERREYLIKRREENNRKEERNKRRKNSVALAVNAILGYQAMAW